MIIYFFGCQNGFPIRIDFFAEEGVDVFKADKWIGLGCTVVNVQ